MKKVLALLLAILVLAMSPIASAKVPDRNDRDGDRNDRQQYEERKDRSKNHGRQERQNRNNRQERERRDDRQRHDDRQKHDDRQRHDDRRDRDNRDHRDYRDHRNDRPHHNWSNPSYKNPNWRHNPHRESLPFRWHERRDHFAQIGHRLVPIYDHGWTTRFPGLRAYRWYHNQGFWYRGHRITNAVMFYDDSDTLVSVGFVHNGMFVFVRDDDTSYENRDSFFLTWLRI